MNQTVSSLAGLVGLGTAAATYTFLLEPEWVEIKSIDLALSRLEPPFKGYRIAHISDLHVDTWLGEERLKDVVDKVNQLRPDIIVITGDFVSDDINGTSAYLSKALRSLTAPDGVVAVPGNHDYRAGIDQVRAMLSDSDIVDLSNRHITLQRGLGTLSIAGVDDILEKQDDLNTVLQNLPQTGAAILLAHEPEFADESAATQRFDLQLSGHSHGGQIRLPFLGPLFLPELGEKYHTGLYQIGGMWQYTNRGIGMVKLKARFNCRPEITLLTLHPVSDYPDWITT